MTQCNVLTLNIKVGTGLDLVTCDCVLAHVLVHGLLDGQLVDRFLSTLILQQLNLMLLPLDLVYLLALEGPLRLLIGPAEGGGEHDLLVLELLDALVLERNHPLVGFLKIEN